MSAAATHDQPLTVIREGLTFGEGPRWHDGRLWFSDFFTHRVLRCAADGSALETLCVVGGRPSGLGWLPDGRLLVVSMQDRRVLRLEADGSLREHADLSGLATWDCNDMVVDASGNAYVGNFGADLYAQPFEMQPAALALVTPAGDVRVAADSLMFPNGTVITPDGSTLIVAETLGSRLTAFDLGSDGTLSNRRVWAEIPGSTPDGICLDADGAVWFADPMGRACVRVAEGGEILERLDTGRSCFACMLGGDDRRTLFLMLAETSEPEEAQRRHDAAVASITVDVPGSGLP